MTPMMRRSTGHAKKYSKIHVTLSFPHLPVCATERNEVATGGARSATRLADHWCACEDSRATVGGAGRSSCFRVVSCTAHSVQSAHVSMAHRNMTEYGSAPPEPVGHVQHYLSQAILLQH